MSRNYKIKFVDHKDNLLWEFEVDGGLVRMNSDVSNPDSVIYFLINELPHGYTRVEWGLE